MLGHRGFLRFHEGQAVLRSEHVKVALTDAHDQVLIGAGQLGLGQIKLLDALLVAGPVGWAIKRLRRADGGALGAVGTVAAGTQIRDDFLRRARQPERQIRRRQNRRLGLIGFRQRCVKLRFGRLVGRIKAACRLVQLDQTLRLRRQRQSRSDGNKKG